MTDQPRSCSVQLMENMKLLTPKERGWVKYHLALAATRDWDYETFTRLFMREIEPVEDAKPEVSQAEQDAKTFDEAMAHIRKYNAKCEAEKVKHRYGKECYCDNCEEEQTRRYDRERAELLKHCRSAVSDDYQQWLMGYRRKGGKIDYVREHKFSGFHVLVSDPGYIPELYGANAVNLIVPKKSNITPRNLRRSHHNCSGHNGIYFLNNFEFVGIGVEIFGDVR